MRPLWGRLPFSQGSWEEIKKETDRSRWFSIVMLTQESQHDRQRSTRKLACKYWKEEEVKAQFEKFKILRNSFREMVWGTNRSWQKLDRNSEGGTGRGWRWSTTIAVTVREGEPRLKVCGSLKCRVMMRAARIRWVANGCRIIAARYKSEVK